MNVHIFFTLFLTVTCSVFAQQTNPVEEELELWDCCDSLESSAPQIKDEIESPTPLRYVVELPFDSVAFEEKIRRKTITGVSLISAGVPLTIIGIAAHTSRSDTTLFPYSKHKLNRDQRITSTAFTVAGVVTTTLGTVTLIRARRMKKWYKQRSLTVAPLIYLNKKSYGMTISYSFSL